MEVPKPITVNTGEQGEVYRNIERFFLEVKSEIEKKVKEEEGPTKFRIENKNLCKIVAGNSLASNEFAHMLCYRERVVAAVFETRTPWNYIHFDYFMNISDF
jgi:hypothetical protein